MTTCEYQAHAHMLHPTDIHVPQQQSLLLAGMHAVCQGFRAQGLRVASTSISSSAPQKLYPAEPGSGCREREEKARQKAAAAAGAFWRRLLAAIFSRARVEAEHNQPAPLQPHLRLPDRASGSAAQAIDLAGDSDGAPMVGEKKQGGRKNGKSEGSEAAGPVAVQKEGPEQQQGSTSLAEPERHAADGADCAAVEEEDI